MQNKPNFRKAQMNVNPYNTTDYENKSNWTLGENKPNSNPIKANLLNAQMNVNKVLTKDYENISPLRAPKKQTQFSKRQKPMQTSLPQRIMKMKSLPGSDKTNPIKPNFRGKKMLLRLTINGRRRSYFAACASLRANPSFLFSKVHRMAKPESTGDERGNLAFDIRNPLFDIRYSPPVSRCYPKTYKKYKETVILKFKRFSLMSLSRSVSKYLNGSKRRW